jgi:hypothetical protein
MNKQEKNMLLKRLSAMGKSVTLAGGTAEIIGGELCGEYKGEPYCVYFNEAGRFVQVVIDKDVKAELIHVLEGREK